MLPPASRVGALIVASALAAPLLILVAVVMWIADKIGSSRIRTVTCSAGCGYTIRSDSAEPWVCDYCAGVLPPEPPTPVDITTSPTSLLVDEYARRQDELAFSMLEQLGVER